MMQDKIQVQPFLINGEEVYVQVEAVEGVVVDESSQGLELLSNQQQEHSQKARDIGQDIVKKLKAVVGQVQHGLKDAQPDEWTVEVGLALEAQAGVFFASGKSNAAIKIQATWKKPLDSVVTS